jgi:hypothetical protein
MTAPLIARVRGYLSVYETDPPVALANDVSLALQTAALSGGRQAPDDPDAGGRIIELRAVAALPGGATASREAQVRLGAALGVSRDWQILTWGERPH